MQDGKKIRQELDKIASKVNRMALTVMKVESDNFMKANFAKQGFQGSSFEAWAKRKTIDKKGRDLTRHRTTGKRGKRKWREGDLTIFGERNKEDRPILTGFKSSGNKLRNSFTCKIRKNKVRWTSYKKYAKRHDEGLKGMPKCQFSGKSPVLDRQIKKEIDKQMKKLFKA